MNKYMISGVKYIPTQSRVTIPGTPMVIDREAFTQAHAEIIFDFWATLKKNDSSFDIEKAMLSTFTIDSVETTKVKEEEHEETHGEAQHNSTTVAPMVPRDSETDFSTLLLGDLQVYASDHNIDLGEATLKKDVLALIQAWAAELVEVKS